MIKLLNSQHVEVTILILSVVGAAAEQLALHEWGNLVVQKCIKGALIKAHGCATVISLLNKVLDVLTHALPTLS